MIRRSGTVFTCELEGIAGTQERLEERSGRFRDLSPAMERIGIEFRQHLAAVFDSDGAAGGAKWPELSPKYAAWKARYYPGRKILSAGGALARAMTVQGASGNIHQVSAREAVFGGGRPAGGRDLMLIHHHGTGRKRIPARPILRLTPAVKARFALIMEEYLAER